MWPRNSTPRCTLRRNEDISMRILILHHEFSQQLICNHQEMKTIHVSISHEWINEIWSIHTTEYYLALKSTKVLIYGTTEMNLKNMLSERS